MYIPDWFNWTQLDLYKVTCLDNIMQGQRKIYYFGEQEPGSNAEIKKVYTGQYYVTFLMMAKSSIQEVGI